MMDNVDKIRRVVTGHDADGQSVIVFNDEHDYKRRVQIWTTEGSPADNSGEVVDAAQRETRLSPEPRDVGGNHSRQWGPGDAALRAAR